MSTNDALNDEISAINSIYEDGTFSLMNSDGDIFSLRLPSFPSIALRLEFPRDYPDAPPSILGTQTVGQDVQKGIGNQVVNIIRDVLAQVYQPGEVCIFDLLEKAREALEEAEEQGTVLLHEHTVDLPTAAEVEAERFAQSKDVDLGPEPPWAIAPPITEKKSIFIARVALVNSPAQAKSYLHHYLSTDKKAAKATHHMTAWRIHGQNDASYQDCDDDGETAAGGRILHLMQLMDVWDVMVVVTRWYGGVQLGPDRFRIINTAAREALILGGFAKDAKENAEVKKKGKK
jgi:hypothetical protein